MDRLVRVLNNPESFCNGLDHGVKCWWPHRSFGDFKRRFDSCYPDDLLKERQSMDLLWILIIVLVIIAVFGGVAVSSLLWLFLIVALILVLARGRL